MINRELAKVLRQMGVFLEMEETPFKPAAYERAALSVEALDKDVAEIFSRGGRQSLKQIPGVGEGIAKTIEEYLKTGQITYLSRLKKKIPVDLDNLLAVEGIGPKTIKELWDKLRIKNLDDLEKAAEAKKIRKLANFGEKSEQNILQGIEFVRRSHGRFLLGEILPEIEQVLTELRRLEQVEKADIAGSLRRGKETIGDADILVISKNPQKVTDFFVSLPDIVKIWGQGTTKASIRTKQGFDIDLRIIPKKSYGAALQYFTGSKEHNIATRKIAIEKGLKLNEYGLFRGKKMIASSQEQDIYKALGLSYIEPELREDQGEIESAFQQFQGKLPGLPKLITNKDVLGDLHCHSHWDGGRDSILEMARTAMSLGYQYIGIADHTKFLRIEHGLDEKQLLRQNREIKSLNSKFQSTNSKQIPNSNFQILHGCEANILNDGSIDIKDSILKKLDFVIAGIHSNMKMPRAQMTKRIIKAMENPNVDIISHPTGRILQKRDEYEVDFEQILRAARTTSTILEINASPDRLDLKDVNIRRAKNLGVKMIINTDSHRKEQLGVMKFGVFQARRGWAEKKDIINCWPLEKLITFLKQ